jgi:hypothetical protein
MNTLLNIVTNPNKVFNRLNAEEKFPAAIFIILLTLVLINMILNVPVNVKLSELVLSGMSLYEEQIDMAIRMTHKLRYLSIVGEFVMYILMLFVYPLILFVISKIFKINLSYSKTLRLLIYCFITIAIGDLINTAFVYFSGIDHIENMYATMLIGINRLTSIENVGISPYMFLSAINPFQIWFVVLLIIGIRIFTDSKWTKSLIVCILYWLIVTLFPIIITHFSRITVANKGLM